MSHKKTGLDYFPLDIDFFNDPKIEFVSAKFGIEGEIIAVKLLCRIYRNGYYLPWDEDQALLFLKRGNINPITFETLQKVVKELVKRGFFNQKIFNKYQILTSNGIQKRYFEASKRRKHIEVNKNYLLVNNLPENVDIIDKKDDTVGGKESKVKESKVKERIILCSVLLKGSNGAFEITDEMADSYQEIYPGMDIPRALKFICKWNEDNPSKRKTPKGIKSHITRFLNSLNDKNKFRRLEDGDKKRGSRDSGSFWSDVAE